jgi:hypothetical protein
VATVIELVGDVKHADAGGEWTPCAMDEAYPEGTRFLTGVRSSIKLRIGEEEPYTCMMIDSVGLTELSEAALEGDTKRCRVGVGFGRIVAGVAEGGLKSDFTVDSPVATLSKRGTWGFSLFYERGTDFFEIGLTERGLVEAISTVQAQRRMVNPREAVTSAMRRWLDEASLRRNVPIPDILGQSDIDVAFNHLQNDGLGVLSPGQGRSVILDLSTPQARGTFAQLIRPQLEQVALPPVIIDRRRPEGFFGTGRGDQLISVLIDANSDLATRGYARPGTYRFRAQALRNWLDHNK